MTCHVSHMRILNASLCIYIHPSMHRTPLPSPLLIEIKRIPAQRTSTSVARLEPLEQTASMEHMLASRAALLRQLAVAADDTVANRTLGLAFESAGDVAAERGDAVGDGAVL
jgi:hypothetical protein